MDRITAKVASVSLGLLLLGIGCAPKTGTSVNVTPEQSAPSQGATDTVIEVSPGTINVVDQEILNGKIEINQVIAPHGGWIVIHQNDNGDTGKILGETLVQQGTSEKVLVTLTAGAEITSELFAMLHADEGIKGTYEFPGPDAPILTKGHAVMEGFKILNAPIKKAGSDQKDEASIKVDTSVEMKSEALEKTIALTAKQWEFLPSSITVTKGTKVKLQITSTDVTHGFSLPDFNVSVALNPGEVKNVEFVADKTGTFSFACSVFCGDGHSSMKGTLIVQ